MINKSQAVLVPEMPKMVAKEQILLYVPVASKENYGTVKLGDSADGNYYFKSENGVLNLDISKVINYMAGDILSSAAGSAQAAANSALAASEAQTTVQSLANDANKSANSAKDSADAAAKLLTRSNLISTIGTVPTTVWGNGVGLMTETQSKNLATLTNLLYEKDPEFIDNLNEVLAAFEGMGEDKTVLNLLGLKANATALDALNEIVAQINIKPGTDTFEGYPAEFAVVQKDGDNASGEDDGKSNYTNATHAAVFGNNNRIIATEGKGNDARNSFTGGGQGHKLYGGNSFIGGGQENILGSSSKSFLRSGIVGGQYNELLASYGFIGGGQSHKITGAYSGIVAGEGNKLSGAYSGIVAGRGNKLSGNRNAIISGYNNTVSGTGSVIAGGNGNTLGAIYSFISGEGNTAEGAGVFVIGYRNAINAEVGAAIGVDNTIGSVDDDLGKVYGTFAIGEGLRSSNDDQLLLGKYNAEDAGASLIFGGGTSDAARKNLYTLRKSGTPEKDTDLVNKGAFYEVAKSKIPNAEAAKSGEAGLMTKAQADDLATLVALLSDNDADTTIDTIKEVLNAFASTPEGTDIANALAAKANASDMNDAIKTLRDEISASLTREELIKVIGFANDTEDGLMSSAQVKFLSSLSSYGTEGLVYEISDDGTYAIFTDIGTAKVKNVVISSSYSGLPVKKIGALAASNYYTMTSVEIPGSVTHIGDCAFEQCTGLTRVTIPNSVTHIGEGAFACCENLVNVTFGKNSQLTTIGVGAFDCCTSLTSITIPDSVTSIGAAAFGDAAFTSIAIPDGVTILEEAAFIYCMDLVNVTFGKNSQLTTIGVQVFDGCWSLTSIIIPKSVTTIDESAFSGCSKLTKVYYGGSSTDWESISVSDDNENLLNATRYYYSETQPTTSGNYWHYVDGKETIWEV